MESRAGEAKKRREEEEVKDFATFLEPVHRGYSRMEETLQCLPLSALIRLSIHFLSTPPLLWIEPGFSKFHSVIFMLDHFFFQLCLFMTKVLKER